MASFCYWDQNRSGFCFLVQISAFVILTSLGLPNLNMKGKTKRILVVLVNLKMTPSCKWPICMEVMCKLEILVSNMKYLTSVFLTFLNCLCGHFVIAFSQKRSVLDISRNGGPTVNVYGRQVVWNVAHVVISNTTIFIHLTGTNAWLRLRYLLKW